MSASRRRPALVLGLGLTALLAGSPAALGENTGSGIWVYPAFKQYFTISVVNLTKNQLKLVKSTLSANHTDNYPFSKGATIPPYRTISWSDDYARTIPPSWAGSLIWEPVGSDSTYGFQVNFVEQGAPKGLAGSGSWISVGPMSSNTTIWAAPGTSSQGRWATPFADKKMHNITTLISSKYMAAVYTGDSLNITVVFMEVLNNNNDGQYIGQKLDWVWNDGYSVP